MTTATREVVERLLSLQDLDLQIQRLERSIRDGPAQLKGLEKQVAEIDGRIQAVRERVAVLRAQVKLRENELKGVEQKIERLRVQSSEVRTNKEFVAFRAEMSNYQADADRIQGEILKILDVVEQADRKVVSLGEERDLAQAKVDAARAKIDEGLEGKKQERDALAGTRPERLEGIPPEPLQIYDRVRRSRGYAVARIEGEYCSACMERLTKNDQISVQNASRLVQCPGCNRILVSG
jgi:uncharacterized protein